MKRSHAARWIAAALAAALAATAATGCAQIQADDLTEGMQPSQTGEAATAPSDDEMQALAVSASDFATRLLAEEIAAHPGENTLVSPASAYYALALAANGAQGETLAQMEGIMGANIGTINAALRAYAASLPETENASLHMANSIWLKDDAGFQVKDEFLQANANFYDAGAFTAPFDESTVSSINAWVRENTGGKIDGILDEIPDGAVTYLVNALSFDAQWADIYEETQISDGTFTAEDGHEAAVDMMHSDEHTYIECDNAVGFMKFYDEASCAFAALLPDEGVSVDELAASLDGQTLADMLGNAQGADVRATIPKFSAEYQSDLGATLQAMGMGDAFDIFSADFSGMATWDDPEKNLFISRVMQKCAIDVDERGTEAGAATAVEMALRAAAPSPAEPIEITLDRPFVYLIVDTEHGLPLFFGAIKSL